MYVPNYGIYVPNYGMYVPYYGTYIFIAKTKHLCSKRIRFVWLNDLSCPL